MTVFNVGYPGCDGQPERVGTVLESIRDAEVPGWRNKV